MSVRINLLPPQNRPPRQRPPWVRALAALAAALVVTGGVSYTSIYMGVLRLEQQAEADETVLQDLRTRLADATRLRHREEAVVKTEAQLNAIASHRWSGLLLTMRELTPKHVTWTSLKAEERNLTLKGMTRGALDVAQLVGGLANEATVEEVALKVMSEKGIALTVSVKPGPTSQAEAKERQDNILRQLGTYQVLEFELHVKLKQVEGSETPHGA